MIVSVASASRLPLVKSPRKLTADPGSRIKNTQEHNANRNTYFFDSIDPEQKSRSFLQSPCWQVRVGSSLHRALPEPAAHGDQFFMSPDSKPALSAPPDPQMIRSRVRTGTAECPLFPKSRFRPPMLDGSPRGHRARRAQMTLGLVSTSTMIAFSMSTR